MNRTIIRGCRVVDPSQELDGVRDFVFEEGTISGLWEPGRLSAAPGDREIDAKGWVAAPGLVDMHVHLRDPGQTHKEDLASGCRAAAAGGVTSLLAMPNTTPAMDSPERIRALLDRAKGADARVYVAAAITKGLKSEQLCDLAALAAAGATALSDDGRPVEDTALLAHAMREAPGLGLRVTAHCEDLSLARGGVMNEGEVSRRLGVRGIPNAAEDAGTAREIALAAAYEVPIHICHVSTAGSVAMIRDAKTRGVRVTAETCPHYFSLTEEALLTRDADYRMNPPLRSEHDRRAIIEGLFDGTIDAIATDHAPHTPQEKADFLTAPNGSIGMETSLAASLTVLVREYGMPLQKLVALLSTAPAKILGLPAGSLQPGAPADVVLFNPGEAWVVDPKALHGKSQNTPFKGMRLFGKVKMTFCAGRIVYQEK